MDVKVNLFILLAFTAFNFANGQGNITGNGTGTGDPSNMPTGSIGSTKASTFDLTKVDLSNNVNFTYTAQYGVDNDKLHFIGMLKTNHLMWIGLGLNNKTDMDGAELVISGFQPGNSTFFVWDLHAPSVNGNHRPKWDTKQDWTIDENDCMKNVTHMKIHMVRAVNTNDAEDRPWSKGEGDATMLLWAVGYTPDLPFQLGPAGGIGYHGKDPNFRGHKGISWSSAGGIYSSRFQTTCMVQGCLTFLYCVLAIVTQMANL